MRRFCLYQGDLVSAEGVLLKPEHCISTSNFRRTLRTYPRSRSGIEDGSRERLERIASLVFHKHRIFARRRVARARRISHAALNVISFAAHWKPRLILIEDTSSGIALIQDLTATTALPIKPVKTGNRNLQARLASVMSLIESGRVFLPKYASWLNDYLREMQNFPRDLHDDRIASTVIALEYYRDKQGFFRGGFWEEIGRFAELRRANRNSAGGIALKHGFVAGISLHKISLADAQMEAQGDQRECLGLSAIRRSSGP